MADLDRVFHLSIPYLVDEVDAELRTHLQDMLHNIDRPEFTLQTSERPLLRFYGLLFATVGQPLPYTLSYQCQLKAGKGDAKIEGLDLLPDEIFFHLDWIRGVGGKFRHGVNRSLPTRRDVEICLSNWLRVLEWFYCEYEKGARLRSIYRRSEPPPIEELPKFPETTAFKGREADLRRLDEAWADQRTNVITVHAWGGVGKSALLGAWLSEMRKDGYRWAAAVYGYSFEGTAGDRFIEDSLRVFGDPEPSSGGLEDKGKRLAELIRRRRTLLVLDGLQAVQKAEGAGEAAELISPALRVLLCSLAADNTGLCVIASRFPVAELQGFPSSKAPVHELLHLSDAAGAAVLDALGVEGPVDELEKASREVYGHALTLNLLGSFLRVRWQGDVYFRDQLRLTDVSGEPGKQAERVMRSYEEYMTANRPRELAALRLVSLFRRPARSNPVKELLARPAIPGLTDDLVGIGTSDWNALVSELRGLRLMLEAPEENDAHELDLHPLVREYFSARLRHDMPEAFREGHNRLYRHFRRSQPNLPDSTLLMGPLYLAVGHGCAAAPAGAGEKLLNDVLETVYWPRIKRGDDGFNTRKLGAFVADLAVLDGFFERRWDRLRGDVPVSSRARLLYEAGFDLRALGRLGESLGPMRSSLAERVRRREWTEAAKTAGDLTLLYATLGQFDRALRTAGYCVRHAEKSRCPFERSRARSNLVHALLQAGEPERAAAAFREAERLVREDAERQGPLPPAAKRPTLQSYWFYELHLDLKDYAKVDELASPSPTGATPTGTPLLDRALAGVALAWSWMGRAAGGDPRAADLLDEARKRLDDALVAVKLAGTNHHLPRVLLASAALHRLRGEWREAELNLKEAAEVSARGEMEAHRADVFLEYARLHLARGLKETARRHLTDARNAVYQMGYRRRVAEVERLERELGQFADGLGIPSPSGS